MTDSSTSASPSGTSGAGPTADPSPGTGSDSTGGTVPSIPDSKGTTGDHDPMVGLDDAVDDDPTLAYRVQIIAVVGRIDEYLPSTGTRDLISASEVQDLLLDLRSLLA